MAVPQPTVIGVTQSQQRNQNQSNLLNTLQNAGSMLMDQKRFAESQRQFDEEQERLQKTLAENQRQFNETNELLMSEFKEKKRQFTTQTLGNRLDAIVTNQYEGNYRRAAWQNPELFKEYGSLAFGDGNLGEQLVISLQNADETDEQMRKGLQNGILNGDIELITKSVQPPQTPRTSEGGGMPPSSGVRTQGTAGGNPPPAQQNATSAGTAQTTGYNPVNSYAAESTDPLIPKIANLLQKDQGVATGMTGSRFETTNGYNIPEIARALGEDPRMVAETMRSQGFQKTLQTLRDPSTPPMSADQAAGVMADSTVKSPNSAVVTRAQNAIDTRRGIVSKFGQNDASGGGNTSISATTPVNLVPDSTLDKNTKVKITEEARTFAQDMDTMEPRDYRLAMRDLDTQVQTAIKDIRITDQAKSKLYASRTQSERYAKAAKILSDATGGTIENHPWLSGLSESEAKMKRLKNTADVMKVLSETAENEADRRLSLIKAGSEMRKWQYEELERAGGKSAVELATKLDATISERMRIVTSTYKDEIEKRKPTNITAYAAEKEPQIAALIKQRDQLIKALGNMEGFDFSKFTGLMDAPGWFTGDIKLDPFGAGASSAETSAKQQAIREETNRLRGALR